MADIALDQARIDEQLIESMHSLSELRTSLGKGSAAQNGDSRRSSMDGRLSMANKKEMIQTLLLARQGMTRELQKLVTHLVDLNDRGPESDRDTSAENAEVWIRFRELVKVSDAKALMKTVTTNLVPEVDQVLFAREERHRLRRESLEREVTRLTAETKAWKTRLEASETEWEQRKAELEQELSEARTSQQRSGSVLQTLSSFEKRFLASDNRVSTLEKALESHKGALSASEGRAHSLESEVSRLTSELQASQYAARSAEEQLTGVPSMLASLRSSLEQKVQSVEAERFSLEQKVQSVEAERSSLERKLSQAAEEKSALARRLSQFEEAQSLSQQIQLEAAQEELQRLHERATQQEEQLLSLGRDVADRESRLQQSLERQSELERSLATGAQSSSEETDSLRRRVQSLKSKNSKLRHERLELSSRLHEFTSKLSVVLQKSHSELDQMEVSLGGRSV